MQVCKMILVMRVMTEMISLLYQFVTQRSAMTPALLLLRGDNAQRGNARIV